MEYNTGTVQFSVVDELDLEEVGLLCFTFYKCQYRLSHEKHWMHLVHAFEKHKGPISDLLLGVFAKYFRYQSPVRKDEGDVMLR